MAKSINKVFLLGNVGATPDVRTVASGKKVAKFSLATSYGKGDAEKTHWHHCTAWDKTAEIVEKHVQKGDRLLVEGSIEYSTSGEGDSKKYFTDIVIREMVMLSGNQEPKTQPSASPFDDDSSDLPF